MTTITESSFVETAVFTKLLAGQGLNLDIGGNALLTLYNQAGVDAPSPEDLYPEELLALEGLQLLQEELADEYFHDKKTQLSPAFKALVSIAVGAFVAPYLVGSLASAISGAISSATGITSSSLLSGITGGLEAFTSTFLVESLDAAVSGDFDIGDILKDAVFSGVSAGLTSGIGLETFGITEETNPALFDGLLGDFGNSNLSLAGVLDGAIDGAISSGLSSAVYGTDFLEGFSSSMVNTLVNLTLADVQYEFGELGVIRGPDGEIKDNIEGWGEGSFPHAILHGLAGCAAGAVQNGGQGCASGAAAGLAQSVLAGSLQGTQLSDEEQQRFAKIVGTFSGFLFSGGDGSNVSIAAHIAESGLRNNRLLHRSEIEWIEEKADEFRNWMCENHGKCNLSVDEAKGILAAETLKGVSESFDLHRVAFGDEARSFIEASYNGPATVEGQTMFGQLDRGSSEYQQELINADTLLNRVGIYELASSQSRWPQGQSVTQAALQEVLAEYAENEDSPQATAFLDAVASNPGRAKLMFAAYGSAKASLVPVLASDFGIQNLIDDLPETMQAEVRLAYVKGLTGKLDLTDDEVQYAILNAKWGPTLTLGFEELLAGAGLLGPGMSLVTKSNGQSVVRDAKGNEYSSIREANTATNRALPDGYRLLGSVGASGNSTGGLPKGYQRAVDPDGNVVVLGPNNKPYRAPGNLNANDDLDALVRGQDRAAQFSGNLNSGSLESAIRNVAGSNPTVSYSNGKTIYTNPQNGNQVVYDRGGDYFRAIDPSKVNKNGGLRRDAYLTLDGTRTQNLDYVPITKADSARRCGLCRSSSR